MQSLDQGGNSPRYTCSFLAKLDETRIYSFQGALAENEAKLASITLDSDGEGLSLAELTQPGKVR